MKDFLDNVTNWAESGFRFLEDPDRQLSDDADPSGIPSTVADGLSEVSDISNFLDQVRQGTPNGLPIFTYGDAKDVIMPIAIPLNNVSISGVDEKKVHINALDLVNMFGASRTTLSTSNYLRLQAVTVVGGDVAPASAGSYYVVRYPDNSSARQLIMVHKWRIGAVDTQSRTARVEHYFPGNSSPVVIQLDDVNKTGEYITFAASPVYKNVTTLNGSGDEFQFTTPSNAEHYRIGYGATLGNTDFDIASLAGSDVIEGLTGDGVEIDCQPVLVSAANLAALMYIVARDK